MAIEVSVVAQYRGLDELFVNLFLHLNRQLKFPSY